MGNAVWALERRVLTAAAHALLESVTCYGLATAGQHATSQGLWEIDTNILRRAARRIVGANITMRVADMVVLADVRTAQNRFVLKSANITDRILRARETAAQRTAETKYRNGRGVVPSGWGH